MHADFARHVDSAGLAEGTSPRLRRRPMLIAAFSALINEIEIGMQNPTSVAAIRLRFSYDDRKVERCASRMAVAVAERLEDVARRGGKVGTSAIERSPWQRNAG
jgi:hypothetical protein